MTGQPIDQVPGNVDVIRDADGDRWYRLGYNPNRFDVEWTMYGPNERQPVNVPNVLEVQMGGLLFTW